MVVLKRRKKSIKKPVKRPVSLTVAIIIAIICLTGHMVIHRLASANMDPHDESERLSGIIAQHDKRMNATLEALADSLSQHNGGSDTLNILEKTAHHFSPTDDYSYYVFRGDSLAFWHNASLPIANITPDQVTMPLMKASNGYFYVCDKQMGGTTVYAMLHVRSTFPYDNDYLTDSFHPSFELPPTANIATELGVNGLMGSGVSVTSPDKQYLFTVTRYRTRHIPTWFGCCSASLLIVFVISVSLAIRSIAIDVAMRNGVPQALGLTLLSLWGLYGLMIMLAPPPGFEDTTLFSYLTFSYGWWLPSLWHLICLSFGILLWSYLFFRLAGRDEDGWDKMCGPKRQLVLFHYFLLGWASFILDNAIIGTLIIHSQGISYYAGDIDVSLLTFIKVGVLGMIFLGFTFIMERVTSIFLRRSTPKVMLTYLISGTIISTIVCQIFFISGGALIGLCFGVFCVIFWAMKKSSPDTMRFSHFVWILVIVNIFVTFRISCLNSDKEASYRKLLASTLAFSMEREDDPVAEQLLPQVYASVCADTTLRNLMHAPNLPHDLIYSQVRNHHMNGYFSRYDLQVVPCRGEASMLHMTYSGEDTECLPYFEQLTEENGRRVAEGVEFYCISDNDGRPCYVGQFVYDDTTSYAPPVPNRLYIQIVLKTSAQAFGYPELLTNKRDRIGESKVRGYSYAKYVGTQLVYHYGNFNYPANATLTADSVPIMPSIYSFTHLIVTPSANQSVIVTYPRQSMSNMITSYAYLFLGMLIVSLLVILPTWGSGYTFIGRLNISERIHASLVIFVLVLFVTVCATTGYQTMTMFEDKNRSEMSGKMSSVVLNLSDELYGIHADDITPSASVTNMVDDILQRIANIYGTDAHMYDPQGRIVGSSRRELFMSGVAAPLMNSEALDLLHQNRLGEVFVKERIGRMTHYATYSPIYDLDNKLMGYVGVPLFNDVREMKNQMLASMVPITNSLMIIIILSIVASSLLARSITRPLLALRDALRGADLQAGNKKLAYPYNDEVGDVVSAYNRMTDKLSEQANKLAAAERENTWRQMARQIAHEIKNPLTPMKLSVQYLLRIWDNRRDSFETALRKTAQTLIEQIDQLTNVASQFSGMAKMKEAEPVRMDLAARLTATTTLFGRSDEANITYDGPHSGVYIMADPALVTSVFNNLVKNAQQSAHDGRVVDIIVSLSTTADKVVVTVVDNGDGMPPEVSAKAFRPNFTTKSTGMGLGLAITKTIIDNTGGTISFETEVGRGTTFTVTLPLDKQT